MRIQIRTERGTLSPALIEHAESRLRFALGRFGDRIAQVAVRLLDENGPRGGVDQRCRVQVALARPRQRIVVEDMDANPFSSVARAAERAGRAAAREIERSRQARAA